MRRSRLGSGVAQQLRDLTLPVIAPKARNTTKAIATPPITYSTEFLLPPPTRRDDGHYPLYAVRVDG